MPRLDMPGKQVFPGARFAFNQGQPYARADLLQLLTDPAHGQRSRNQLRQRAARGPPCRRPTTLVPVRLQRLIDHSYPQLLESALSGLSAGQEKS